MKIHFKKEYCILAMFFTLMVPNVLLVITERQIWTAAVCNLLMPFGVYAILASLSLKVGKTIWMMFPFIFLAAFQIVLTCLFGRSIIGVDMYLNLVTTNADEVGEMLGGILSAVIIVAVLYLPLLGAGVVAVRKSWLSDAAAMVCQRRVGIVSLSVGMAAYLASFLLPAPVVLADDVFPANVIYNLGLAIERSLKTARYAETSRGFSFGAVRRPAADDDEPHAIAAASREQGAEPQSAGVERRGRSVVLFVIGETARAENFGILGYERNTTPNLSCLGGLYAFSNALSESNTTHKSVPMLMSAVNAATFSEIYRQKSIITAFKEAGYATAFFSNQLPNHSFIDFFGEEADTCLFVKNSMGGERKAYDADLLACAESFIAGHGGRDLLIVLHCYGSHFNYSDRYPPRFRRYMPDAIPAATNEYRANLVNAYDNSILYTDYILSELAKMLSRNASDEAVMLYTSDHGEELYDDGKIFMHASPVPSMRQLHVPLLVWTSPAYAETHKAVVRSLDANRQKRVSTSTSIFHTLAQMADISMKAFKPSLSVADKRYRAPEPRYITDRNESINLMKVLNKESFNPPDFVNAPPKSRIVVW